MGVKSKVGTYSGPSRTRATFVPALSVLIFGYFWPSCIILTGRAPCSVPSCTPDAWTNGPFMVCGLCILVPTAHMPRGRTNVPTHKDPTQDGCGQFCHFGKRGRNSGHHHAMASEDLWQPSMREPTFDSPWVRHGILSSISKPSRRNALGDIFFFGLFWGMPNHPILDPNFSPPCRLLATPYLQAQKDSGPNSRFYT